MYELNGKYFTLAELEQAAEFQNLDFDSYLSRMQEKGLKEIENFQSGPGTGAVSGPNNTASQSGDGLSGLLNRAYSSPIVGRITKQLLKTSLGPTGSIAASVIPSISPDTSIKSTVETAQGLGTEFTTDPIGVAKELANAFKTGGAGLIDTSIEIGLDNMKDVEEMMTLPLVMAAEGLDAKKASSITKDLIKKKDDFFSEGYGRFLKFILPTPLQFTTTSREDIEKAREPFKRIIENERAKYDNTISEEIGKGMDADFSQIASRIISDGLTSTPYTLASLNPYTAAALGVGIAGDKFVEEVEKNPDKGLFRLYGNAITTGGIEMADAYLTRRFFKSAGFLGRGKTKNVEKAAKELNKGISSKLLGILGIGVKEGATEIGQAIATRINDKVWFDTNDVFSEGGGLFTFEDGKMVQGRLAKGIMKDAFSIIDEGIIGAFSGGGISTVAAGVQNNDIIKDRVEYLLMPESVRKDRNALYKEFTERNIEIQKALKLGTDQGNRRAAALKGINNKTAKKILELQNKSRLVIDNIKGKELEQYASNVDAINSLVGDKTGVTKSVQKEIDNLVKENNQIFDNALKQNYGENISFAEVAAGQLGFNKIKRAKTTTQFNNLIKKLSGKTIKDSSGINGVFIGKGQIVINEEVALKLGSVGVGSHEILHPILNAMVGNISAQETIVKDFQDTLTRRQRRWTDNEMKRQGKIEGTKEYYSEYINVFSEGLVKNRISFDLNFGEQVKDFLTSFYKGKGFNNIDFRSGRGVYNFMKAYDASIKKGKLSKEVLSALDTKLVKEAETLGKEMQKSEISNEIQRIYEQKGFDGAFEIASKYEGMANKQAQRFREVPGFASMQDILVDEILTGRRGVIDLIRSYNPGSNVPLAAYINKFLSSRVIEVANRVLDTNFKTDVTEARGITAAEETTEQLNQRDSLRISLNLTQEVIDKVKNAVVKSFGTKMPEVSSKQFKKKLINDYKTFLKPTIARLLGRQADFQTFLDANFKLIYDILPQSTINKRFAPFAEPVVDENGKQLREKTAQGNKIFKKKNITKEEFVNYFLGDNVGASTKGTRKTALAEALAQEIAFDATLDVLRNPDIFDKIKAVAAIQEIDIADNYLSQVAQQIDRGVDFQFSQEAYNAADLYSIRDAIMEGNLHETFPNVYEEIVSAAKSLGLNIPGAFKGVTFESYVTKVINDRKSPTLTVIGDGLMGPTGTDVVFKLTTKRGKISLNTEIKNGVRDQFGSGGIKITTNPDGSYEFSSTNPLMDVMMPLIEDNIEIYEKLHKRAEEIQNEKIPFKFPQTGYLKTTWDQIKDEFRAKERNINLRFDNSHIIEKFYLEKGINLIYIGNKGLFYLGNNKDNINAPKFESKSKMYASLRSSGTNKTTGKVNLTLRAFNSLIDGKSLPKGTLATESNFENNYFQFSKESDNLSVEFNDILEQATGIASQKRYSEIEGRKAGRKRGFKMFNFFIPPGAEDFQGLMYNLLPSGKNGDAAIEWFKQNVFQPYSVAISNINADKMNMMANFKALKKKLSSVPSILDNKIPTSEFTYQDAVRVYIWNSQKMDIPGLSQTEQKLLVNAVKKNKDLKQFANELKRLNGDVGYSKPGAAWDSGNITSDLKANLSTGVREKHLTKWQENVDTIFSAENLAKLEATQGAAYVRALKNILRRMQAGRNRFSSGNAVVDNWMEWVNNSVGVIMFINVRSAVLQTISTVNYMNWSDNNPLQAAKAYANQPQYWKDFAFIFNSDFLKQRRGGLELNVNENEIAEMGKKHGVRGTISYLLNKGFVLTRFADSWAIANGGAAFYRNRVNTYIKQGLSEQEAQTKAFGDFRELTEENQQSSRPDRISEQQAGGLGRVILAFANTPMQYTRLMKRAAQDLVNNRGDYKTNMSKIAYYGFVQNFIFNALQQAVFALGFSDDPDDEKREGKYINTVNGMLDSILRGTGVAGAAVSAAKNVAVDVARRANKPRPQFAEAAWKLFDISPPISSKVKRVRGGLRTFDYEMDEIKKQGLSFDNPANYAIGQIISAATNVPIDRTLKLFDNYRAAVAEDAEAWQRVALLLGWSDWELDVEADKKDNSKKIRRTNVRKPKIR